MNEAPSQQRAPELTEDDLRDAWQYLSAEERRQGFLLLPTALAEDFFLALPAAEMAALIVEKDALPSIKATPAPALKAAAKATGRKHVE